MVPTVVAFAHNHVQVGLASALRVANSLLENLFGFLDILAVEIDSIASNFSYRIVLPENVLRSLLVVLIGLRGVLLALFAQLMRLPPVTAFVCILRLGSTTVILV